MHFPINTLATALEPGYEVVQIAVSKILSSRDISEYHNDIKAN